MTSSVVSPALLAALRERGDTFPVERVDQVWLFTPRQTGPAESSLAVLSLFDDDAPSDRRRILTLHCAATTERGRTRREDALVEQGSVPADRVDRMIQGVLHRLRDAQEGPRSELIDGRRDRWDALVGTTGGTA